VKYKAKFLQAQQLYLAMQERLVTDGQSGTNRRTDGQTESKMDRWYI